MHVVSLDLSDPEIATELLALQRRGYEVEAALIGSRDIPPLEETLDELQGARKYSSVSLSRAVSSEPCRIGFSETRSTSIGWSSTPRISAVGSAPLSSERRSPQSRQPCARSSRPGRATNRRRRSISRRLRADRRARGRARTSYRAFQQAAPLTDAAPKNDATVTPRGRTGRSSRQVHAAGSLSSRKRMSFVPWRKRFDCTLS